MAAKKTSPKSDMVKMFKEADKDDSGCLNLEEMKNLLRKGNCNITDSQIKEVFCFFQEDEDQKITEEEFCNGLEALEEYAKNVEKAFKEHDVDHSGCLDRSELTKLLKGSGCNFTDAEIEEILKRADPSGDGKVCYEEFIQAFT